MKEKTNVEKLKDHIDKRFLYSDLKDTNLNTFKTTCEAILKDIDDGFKGRYGKNENVVCIKKLIEKGLK